MEADDVAHLLDEKGVVGELEMARVVGLDTEQAEPALHSVRTTSSIG